MPVYVYYGEEQYLRDETVSQLKAQVVNPAMAALCLKELKNPSVVALTEAVGAVSMALGGSTLIEVKQFGPLREKPAEEDEPLLEPLKEALALVDGQKHVVFVSDKVDKKFKFPKWLTGQKWVKTQEFKCFKPWETEKAADALVGLALSRGIAVDRRAATLLTETMGCPMLPLMNELTKLSVYTNGETILPQHVLALSDHNENTSQMLADWVKGQHRERVFKTLHEVFLRQHPLPLFAFAHTFLGGVLDMMTLRQLGYSQEAIASELGKHPFKVKMDLQEYGRVPYERLVALKNRAVELEWQMKSGQLDGHLGFELLMGA